MTANNSEAHCHEFYWVSLAYLMYRMSKTDLMRNFHTFFVNSFKYFSCARHQIKSIARKSEIFSRLFLFHNWQWWRRCKVYCKKAWRLISRIFFMKHISSYLFFFNQIPLYCPSLHFSHLLLFLLFLQKKLTKKKETKLFSNSFSSFFIFFMTLYANNTSMVCGRSIQIGNSFLLFFSPSSPFTFHTHFSIPATAMEGFLRLIDLSYHGWLRGNIAALTDESEIHHTKFVMLSHNV